MYCNKVERLRFASQPYAKDNSTCVGITSSILNCYQLETKASVQDVQKMSYRHRLCFSSLGHPVLYLVNQRERVFISWFWPCIVWELVNMCEDVFVVDRECLGPVMQHLKSGEKMFHVKGMSLFFRYMILEEESNYFFGNSSTLSISCLLNTKC